MNGDQIFYIISFILGFLLLFRGKNLFFLFPSLVGSLWFVAIQDQLIGERQPRFYLISFLVAFSAIAVGYFVFKKVFLKVLVFFGGLYLGFAMSVVFGVNDILIELAIGAVMGLVLLFLFMKLFDVTLVIISSVVGSVLIYMTSREMWDLPEILMPGIAVIGIGTQLFISGKGNSKDAKQSQDKSS